MERVPLASRETFEAGAAHSGNRQVEYIQRYFCLEWAFLTNVAVKEHALQSHTIFRDDFSALLTIGSITPAT